MLSGMPSFGVSIVVLSLAQAATVMLAAPGRLAALARFRGGLWAALPAASIVGFVVAVRALSGVADGLTYLALAAVPPLAAIALGAFVRGARRWWAAGAVVLFALAWADRGGLAGEGAGLTLDALSCVTLGVLLAALAPRRLLELGIVAMALIDAVLVASDLLSAPNGVLNAAAPAASLPALQRVVFGSAVMGYGDIFIAALLGALLAPFARQRRRATLLVAVFGLLLDLLFLVVGELPATVPAALALLVVAGVERRAAKVSG
jgi:hypothetical protein